MSDWLTKTEDDGVYICALPQRCRVLFYCACPTAVPLLLPCLSYCRASPTGVPFLTLPDAGLDGMSHGAAVDMVLPTRHRVATLVLFFPAKDEEDRG